MAGDHEREYPERDCPTGDYPATPLVLLLIRPRDIVAKKWTSDIKLVHTTHDHSRII